MKLERIILDCRAWHKRPGGIRSYTRALVERLPAALPDVKFVLLRHPEGPVNLNPAPNTVVRTMPGMPHGPATLLLKPKIRPRSGDLYHALFPFIPLGLQIPVVITVHDLMWFHSKHLVSESGWSRWFEGLFQRVFVSHACRRATRILSNSRSTKNDLVARWPILQDKIRVVPFAPSPVFTNGQLKPDRSRVSKFVPETARYFLVVGNGSRNKNHEIAVRAFARAFSSRTDVHLVVIQRSRVGLPRFRQEVQKSGVAERIHLHGPVEDADIVALMRYADGFVFPSRYEGFGIPVLEAMASGCPVLCSDTSSLPEVAGKAALIYGPDDVDGFAEGMRKVSDDNALRQNLIARGRQHVQKFTWERCVEGTISAYQEAVSTSFGNSSAFGKRSLR